MTDFTLLYEQTINQVYDETITVADITNYKYIYAGVYINSTSFGGDILFETVFVPVSLLKSSYAKGIQANGYTTARTYLIVGYASNTQLRIQSSGKYKVFGIK